MRQIKSSLGETEHGLAPQALVTEGDDAKINTRQTFLKPNTSTSNILN